MSTIKVDTIATRTGSGNITLSNSLASATVAGDLTVDTNTLFVDASENKVGIGTTTPDTFADYVSTSLTNTLTIAGSFPGLQLSDTDISGSQSTFGMSKAGQGLILNNLGTGDMQYFLNGGERVRFQASGGISFNGDTAAANALDDYEEGTWTPFYTTANNNLTLNGNASTTASMYLTQSGSYVKIGKKVIAAISIATNGVTSHAGSGNLWIGGLPFTAVTTSSTEPRGVNGCMGGRFNTSGDGFTPDQLVGNSNATTLQIRAGFESYPTRSNLDTGGSSNRNVIEALIVYSTA